MKKILTLLLVAVMTVTLLVACDNKNPNSTDTGSGSLVVSQNDKTDATNTDNSSGPVPGSPVVSQNDKTDATNTDTSSDSGTVVVPNDSLTKEILVGTWGFETNLKEIVPEMGMDATFKMYMTFTEDEKITLFAKESELFDTVEDAARSLLTKEFVAQQAGVSVDELEKALAQQGLTWDSYVDTSIEVAMESIKGENSPFPPSDSNGNITLEKGYYKLENEKLYISSTTEFTESEISDYTYEKGVLTITEDGIEMEMKKQ